MAMLRTFHCIAVCCSSSFFHSRYSTRRFVLVRPVLCPRISAVHFMLTFARFKHSATYNFGEMLARAVNGRSLTKQPNAYKQTVYDAVVRIWLKHLQFCCFIASFWSYVAIAFGQTAARMNNAMNFSLECTKPEKSNNQRIRGWM